MKRMSLRIGIIFLTLLSAPIQAVKTTLILDTPNTYQTPKSFRTTEAANTEDLKQLHLMGSAQFSAKNLHYVIDHYPKPQYLFDLRQESHGFINGIAVSWFGKNNWANLNNPRIIETENHLLSSIRPHRFVTIEKALLRKQGRIVAVQPITLWVKNRYSEQQLAKQLGIHYVRIPVADHRRPSDEEVDHFVNIIRKLPKGTWLYFHCRGGMGRTTSFMSMVDMMHNAKKVSLQDILQRQHLLGGQNLLSMPAKDAMLYPFAVERLALLKKFYQYCRENQDGFRTSWTSWLKQSQ